MTQEIEQSDPSPATALLRRITVGSFALVSVLCLAVFVTLGIGSITHAATDCTQGAAAACAMPMVAIAP